MSCMVLEDGAQGVGEVLGDGPTGIDLIGDGVVIGGEVLALVHGARITKVIVQRRLITPVPILLT